MRALRISRPTKYHSVPSEYGGRRFASKAEAAHAFRLDQLKSAADPKERVVAWVAQVRVPLVVNGQHITTYVCDFEATYADGHIELHEVKGVETDSWKIKEKLFRALHPDLSLKVIR